MQKNSKSNQLRYNVRLWSDWSQTEQSNGAGDWRWNLGLVCNMTQSDSRYLIFVSQPQYWEFQNRFSMDFYLYYILINSGNKTDCNQCSVNFIILPAWILYQHPVDIKIIIISCNHVTSTSNRIQVSTRISNIAI